MRYITLWDSYKGRELIRKRNPSVYKSLMAREKKSFRKNELLRSIAEIKATIK